MHDQGIDTESVAALQFISQSGSRLLDELLIRAAQVDQVGGVRDDRLRPLLARLPELVHLGGIQLRALPAVGALDEDLQRVAADCRAPFEGRVRPACDGYMCTEKVHDRSVYQGRGDQNSAHEVPRVPW